MNLALKASFVKDFGGGFYKDHEIVCWKSIMANGRMGCPELRPRGRGQRPARWRTGERGQEACASVLLTLVGQCLGLLEIGASGFLLGFNFSAAWKASIAAPRSPWIASRIPRFGLSILASHLHATALTEFPLSVSLRD